MVRKYANSNFNANRPQFRDDSFIASKSNSIRIFASNSNIGVDEKYLLSKDIEEWDAFEVEFKARHGFDFPF